MMARKVFISMGTPYSSESRAFRDALEDVLRDQCGVDPRIMGKNEYPDGNPLAKIRTVMADCDGVIVVAYERKFVREGIEKRSGETPIPLSAMSYTTPWNHIESAMAFNLGIPLYILCQRGLTEEGLIETKVDWYVQYVDLKPEDLQAPAVLKSLQNWIATRVVTNSRSPRFFRTLEGRTKISEMTPKEIAGALGIVTASFGLGVVAASWLPELFT